jgi:hypothetical protein
MLNAYLWLNVVIYVGFAAWITVNPWGTAQAAGYQSLSSGGRTEYLAVYGGLQLGVAAFYAWSALTPGQQRAGLMFSLFLYVGIVAYRSISLWKYWPVSRVTLSVATLEILLLLGALAIYLRDSGLRNR